MAENSFSVLRDTVRFIGTNRRQITIVALYWFVPVQILRFLLDRVTNEFLPLWTIPIMDRIGFPFLFGLFSIAIVQFLVEQRFLRETSLASISPDRKSRWFFALWSFTIPLVAAVPLTIIQSAWPDYLIGPFRHPNATIVAAPFILIEMMVGFSAYLMIPPAVFSAAYDEDLPLLVNLIGAVLFFLPTALAATIRMAVATRLFSLADPLSSTDDANVVSADST